MGLSLGACAHFLGRFLVHKELAVCYPAKHPKAEGCVGKGKGRDVEPRSRTSWRHAWNPASVEDLASRPASSKFSKRLSPWTTQRPCASRSGLERGNPLPLCPPRRLNPDSASPIEGFPIEAPVQRLLALVLKQANNIVQPQPVSSASA
jgi:hypothetical protein